MKLLKDSSFLAESRKDLFRSWFISNCESIWHGLYVKRRKSLPKNEYVSVDVHIFTHTYECVYLYTSIYVLWCARAYAVTSVVSSSAIQSSETCQAPLSVGTLQARILEWVAIAFSRGFSRPRDWTSISCISGIAGRFFTTEAPLKSHVWWHGSWF